MKKILLSLSLLMSSLSGISQSFLADSKSITVPRYDNLAAINIALPTPTAGQLVYNNAFNLFLYFNGTSWVYFPLTSSGGTQPWTIVSNDIKYNTGNVGIGTGTPAPTATLEVYKASDVDTSPQLAIGSLNKITTRYYNSGSGTGGVYEVITPNTTASNASIVWRNKVGSTITPMMTLTGSGNLTVSGNEAIAGTLNVTANATVGSLNTGGLVVAGLSRFGNDVESVGYTKLGNTGACLHQNIYSLQYNCFGTYNNNSPWLIWT